ncbi:8-amino-7-oxononanoate synthase [Methanofervidicoccus sp. A16]|uniref:8-amino-7-oxononanoate synthase n=1 Tax=Methanofervidicoccus sp. A16 TaxID=2607662 RepID=UPI00118CE624|nr:8-amino-7-oxononanoate synthase [Methanofervidicoccus sp. A16]AXI25365.1 8-amino-7-oxononanoate synthase [Methanofervidicoccus sp. A16]
MFRSELRRELETIMRNNLYRSLRKKREDILDFSSNDYLCLSKHPEVIEAVKEGLKYGLGSTGSRLTSGNINHEILEERLAEFKETERALLYPTGYSTNIGVISALCKRGDLILSDRLNHASIIDGCRLSRADVEIYEHCNVESLVNILEEKRKNYNNIFIITDGVFSMDGDIAPLEDIKRIADEYNGVVIVDDAHGTGVLGRGKGTLKHFNLKPSDNIIQIGTLSKAFGGLGGFVCGIEEVIEYLINTSRSFIYSTALPPSLVSGALKSLELIEEGHLTKKLQENIRSANRIFRRYNLIEEDSLTPIYPIILGDRTMEVSEYLLKNGIYAPGIRYPSVPKGLERIRVSINVGHREEDFERLGRLLNDCIS